MVFIQNYLDCNTLPDTGGDWGVFLRTLEEVLVESEQRDVEIGVSELLLQSRAAGHPHTLPVSCSLPVQCTPKFAVVYNSIPVA
jgi:hypothetical protein